MQHEALRLVRQFHNVSLTEAAQRLEVSKSFLSQVENGHKKPSLDFLEAFAKSFDMPLSGLLLFSETVGTETPGAKVRAAVAGTALRLLKWVEMKSRDDDGGTK